MAIGLQPVVVLKSSIEVVFGLVVGNRHLLEGSHYRIRPTLDRNQPIPRHFRPVLRRNRPADCRRSDVAERESRRPVRLDTAYLRPFVRWQDLAGSG